MGAKGTKNRIVRIPETNIRARELPINVPRDYESVSIEFSRAVKHFPNSKIYIAEIDGVWAIYKAIESHPNLE